MYVWYIPASRYMKRNTGSPGQANKRCKETIEVIVEVSIKKKKKKIAYKVYEIQ